MPVREGDGHRQERSVSRDSHSKEAFWKPEALPRDKCLDLCIWQVLLVWVSVLFFFLAICLWFLFIFSCWQLLRTEPPPQACKWPSVLLEGIGEPKMAKATPMTHNMAYRFCSFLPHFFLFHSLVLGLSLGFPKVLLWPGSGNQPERGGNNLGCV